MTHASRSDRHLAPLRRGLFKSSVNLERMANGKISAKRELLWNDQRTWPEDSNDQREAPFGRPIMFWVPYVNNQAILWDGKSGFPTKKDALNAAISFISFRLAIGYQLQAISFFKPKSESN